MSDGVVSAFPRPSAAPGKLRPTLTYFHAQNTKKKELFKKWNYLLFYFLLLRVSKMIAGRQVRERGRSEQCLVDNVSIGIGKN